VQVVKQRRDSSRLRISNCNGLLLAKDYQLTIEKKNHELAIAKKNCDLAIVKNKLELAKREHELEICKLTHPAELGWWKPRAWVVLFSFRLLNLGSSHTPETWNVPKRRRIQLPSKCLSQL
jgi:hypothetical protein